MSPTPWWPRHMTHNIIHTHKHTMKIRVTCLPPLRSTGSTALRHPHSLPPSQIRREQRMMEGEEKAMMKGGDLVLTTSLTQITIQMVVATTGLAKPCHTTAIANPFHLGVTVAIVSLRNPQRGLLAHRITPESSKRMWCWGGALCPGHPQRGWPRGRVPWPSCSSGSTSGGAWLPRRTSTGRSLEKYNTHLPLQVFFCVALCT